MDRRVRAVAALTIAGSDNGAGAGIQADLKTFEAHDVFGVCAITAITAQNTMGVQSLHALSLEVVRAQIESVCSDFDIRVAKTGMLVNAATVTLVVSTVPEDVVLVVDPVCSASSGRSLLTTDGLDCLRRELLPRAKILTPNLQELALLLDEPLEQYTRSNRRETWLAAARGLARFGSEWILIKGGHESLAHDNMRVDLLWDARNEMPTWIQAPHVDSEQTHGTGCTYASAIAANLTRGMTVRDSVVYARGYLQRAIEAAQTRVLGQGRGSLVHRVETGLNPSITLF